MLSIRTALVRGSTSCRTRDAGSVAVCGARLAGCVTARLLADQGVDVTIFDGGRGAGGRMSSRKIDGRSFDHGAVCLSSKLFRDVGNTPSELEKLLVQLEKQGVLKQWDARIGKAFLIARVGL